MSDLGVVHPLNASVLWTLDNIMFLFCSLIFCNNPIFYFLLFYVKFNIIILLLWEIEQKMLSDIIQLFIYFINLNC